MTNSHVRAFAAGLVGILLSVPALAQSITVEPYAAAEVVRWIPTAQGGGEARRLLAFDADADLMQDLAVVWSNGEMTFAYAPEIVDSILPCPTNAVRDAASIPARFAPAAAAGGDGLLVAEAQGLVYVHLAPEPTTPHRSASSLVRQSVTAPAPWHEAVGLHVHATDAQCYVLALAADRHEIRFGTWLAGTITELGTVVAAGNVQQLLLVDFLHDGVLHLAARTNTGLQVWNLAGGAPTTFAAPLIHWHGAMTTVRDGNTTQIAWAVLDASNWRLRTVLGPTLLQDTPIVVPPGLAPRFRIVGLNPTPSDIPDRDALVLHQNSGPWHLVFERNGAAFETRAAVGAPGTTFNVDNCASVVADLNRDGRADVATVLTSGHLLQLQTSVTSLAAAAPGPALLESIDLVADKGALVALGGVPESTVLHLAIELPASLGPFSDLRNTTNLAVHVVAWPQPVTNPAGPQTGPTPGNGFGPMPTQAPVANHLFVWQPGAPFRRRVYVPLRAVADTWDNRTQYYLMLRVVRLGYAPSPGSTVAPPLVWASAPQLIGYAAEDANAAFMQAIAVVVDPPPSQQGPVDPVPVSEPRNVGAIVHRKRPQPPPVVLPLPTPGAPVVVTPNQ